MNDLDEMDELIRLSTRYVGILMVILFFSFVGVFVYGVYF
jgi:hypothetical protein